jgi:flagellar protein FlbD
MIQLTRLNNTSLALNSDLIKYVEQAPDTVITLLNGEKLVVRETTDQVIARVLEFRRAVVSGARNGRPDMSGDEFTYPHCFSNARLSAAERDRG